MVCLICLRCAIFRDEVSKGIVDVLLCAWSNTAFPAQPSTSNLGNVRDGRGRCDKTHSVRMVLFPSPSPWWGFPRATARSTALLRLCLQSCSRLLFFFRPVCCAFVFSPISPSDAHQVAQAYPQLASKELTFGFKVIYKDLVRTRLFLGALYDPVFERQLLGASDVYIFDPPSVFFSFVVYMFSRGIEHGPVPRVRRFKLEPSLLSAPLPQLCLPENTGKNV